MRRLLQAFFTLALCSCMTVAGDKGDEDAAGVPLNIGRLQGESGGFHKALHEPATLRATADAVILVSAYGLLDSINKTRAVEFVAKHRGADGGYGQAKGVPSDISSTFNAVQVYYALHEGIVDRESIIKYIHSAQDSNTGLFSRSLGGHSPLVSTGHAIRALKLLGEDSVPQSDRLRVWLEEHRNKEVEDDGKPAAPFEFADAGASGVEVCEHAVTIAKFVDYELDENAVRRYFLSLQQLSDPAAKKSYGGFRSDGRTSEVSTKAARSACLGLHQLDGGAAGVDFKGILHHVKHTPKDLEGAMDVHTCIMVNPDFSEWISGETLYSSTLRFQYPNLMTGALLKPYMVVTMFNGALPHGGFDVTFKYRLPSGEKGSFLLEYNDSEKRYDATDEVNCDEELGKLEMKFEWSANLPIVGRVSGAVTEEVSVGFGIKVDASATLGGKELAPSENVSYGSDFKFGVKLFTREEDNITSGDFDVTMHVVDSSEYVLHEEVHDCSQEDRPISFGYYLDNGNVPAGPLHFRFTVRSKSGVVHTSHTVSYGHSIPMVASDIKFAEGNDLAYRIGDKIRVTMTPGTARDVQSPQPISSGGGRRRFFMDLSTAAGVVVMSYEGTTAGSDGHEYAFDFSVPASLDFVGELTVSFRYVSSQGKSIPLYNYDGSIMDDPVTFSTDADIRAQMVSSPESRVAHYGEEMRWALKVKDAVTGSSMTSGAGGSSVYLGLAHESSRRRLSLTPLADAVVQDSVFVIVWTVDLNAKSGPVRLALGAENADGQDLVLLDDKKKVVDFNMEIGGDITVETRTYAPSADADHSIFVFDFRLFCQGRALTGADLTAKVMYEDEPYPTKLNTAVATSADSMSYQVTFTMPHHLAPTGTYRVDLFRPSGELVLSLSSYHKEVSKGSMIVRMDFLLLVALGYGIVWASGNKSKLARA